jgi:hypothetical protein
MISSFAFRKSKISKVIYNAKKRAEKKAPVVAKELLKVKLAI